jgi:hypothetical protein
MGYSQGVGWGAGMEQQKIRREEALICSLVFMSVSIIIVMAVMNLSPDWLFTLFVGDLVICVVFAWDFGYRLSKSASKLTFLRCYGFEVLTFVPAIVFHSMEHLLIISAGLRALRLITAGITLRKDARFLQSAQKFLQKSRLLTF